MRISVVLPPLRDFYLSPRRVSALGCRTLAALLEKAGHSVRLFIFPLRGKGRPCRIPPEAAYLEEWILPGECGPLSFFTGIKRFGPDWQECARIIAEDKPNAVLISSFAYAYAEDAVLLAAALRKSLPESLLVAGGAGPCAWPAYYLAPPETKAPVFDAVFAGEAEAGLPLLLEFLASGARAEREPVLLRAREFTQAKDLDCVFAVQRETPAGVWASVCLSRGCRMGCKFCSARLCHGGEFRTADLRKIETGAARLSGRLAGRRRHLNFEDDNMLLDPAWLDEGLGILRARFPRIAFAAENGLDYRLLSPRAAEHLISQGFEKFNLSLGSLTDTGARGRKTDSAAYLATANTIAARGLPLVGYFIAGLENDTDAALIHHLAFLAQAPGLAGISLFYAVPGLPGFAPPPAVLRRYPGLARGSLAYPWTGALTTGQLVTAFRLARLVNLMKKPERGAGGEELVERCFTEKKLFTLRRETGNTRLTPAPADRELEKLFFETLNAAAVRPLV